MTAESPFFFTKVECPICRTVNEFETIKVGAYSETGRDTDFRPTERTWRNPRYQAYNPLLYFTATCSNCFYTREFSTDFKEWKDDAYFKTYRLKAVKERHLELLAEPDSVIKAIGGELDAARHPNETAVLKLLLAILDEDLNEKGIDLDLGRFFLRIAWLFREMDSGENPNLQAIKGYLIDIESKLGRMKGGLDDIRFRLAEIEKAVAAQFDDDGVSAEIKSILYPIRDKYAAELKSFNDLLTLVDGKVEALDLVTGEHRQAALGTSSSDVQPGFHNHASFDSFLRLISSKWNKVPLSEKDALRQAAFYYRRAYEGGREIGDGNQKIQASYLIAELSRRIDDFDTAKEYFNATIRAGQEFIYKNRNDQSRTALARKILELAIEQGRMNLAEAKTAG